MLAQVGPGGLAGQALADAVGDATHALAKPLGFVRIVAIDVHVVDER